jgi:hypothetical protein
MEKMHNDTLMPLIGKNHQHIETDSDTSNSNSTEKHAPGNLADYWFCSSQCSAREGSKTGRAMPRMKPNSTTPEVCDAFVALTSLQRKYSQHGDQTDQHLNHWILKCFLNLLTRLTRIIAYRHFILPSHQLGNHVDATITAPQIQRFLPRLYASQLYISQ